MNSSAIIIKNPFLDSIFPIIQRFGENLRDYAQFGLIGHNGYDFACPIGSRLYAAVVGKVTKIGFEDGGYGNYVRITTPWGRVIYAHLSSIGVVQGQEVNLGDFIGLSGCTGYSDQPHLHLEVRFNGLENNGYNGAVDYAQYTDGWMDGTAGGSSQPITSSPADIGDPRPEQSLLVPNAAGTVTLSMLRLRDRPTTEGQEIGWLNQGSKLNFNRFEEDASGNVWGLVDTSLWCAIWHDKTLYVEVGKDG